MSFARITTFKLLLAFIKIGLIGFGGGSVLIPVIDREFIQKHNAMSRDDYLKHTIIANITPGALPVKLGATCGQQLNGVNGSLLSAYGVAVPSVCITVFIMALFTILGNNVLEYFNYASVGISWFIIYLLLHYITKTISGLKFKQNLILCAISFLITCGKEIREIVGAISNTHSAAIFDISTIDLMIVTFFLIIIKTMYAQKSMLLFAVGLSGIYIFLKGAYSKSHGFSHYGSWVLLIMAMFVAVLLIQSRRKTKSKSFPLSGSVYRALAYFLGIPFVLTCMIAVLTRDYKIITFVAHVCISTLTSFGGGEAYVSVADGIFVQGGYISAEMFYTRLLPVANALPGPVLVKIAAGIGFVYGSQIQPIFGWLMALAATTTAIGVCSSVAILLLDIYDSVRNSAFIQNLQQYVLPVICGMLLSTSCAILYESMKVTVAKGIGSILLLTVSAFVVCLLFIINKRKHINDLIWIFSLAGISILFIIGFAAI